MWKPIVLGEQLTKDCDQLLSPQNAKPSRQFQRHSMQTHVEAWFTSYITTGTFCGGGGVRGQPRMVGAEQTYKLDGNVACDDM